MNRKMHDSTVLVHSSIALLQERFMQLQRVKEMREKRELVKMLNITEPQHFNSTNPTKKTRLTSPPHVSLSLWPTSKGMMKEDKDSNIVETPVLMNLYPAADCAQTQPLHASWKNVYDWDLGSDSDTGVDTSLHL
ncbi:uncharacterized protein LOC130710630 [Lotus japonicus]|uniref:uncharacterized protein LOC130710630 n=1 Tax=Lotus japonicus TaxID=34305 RepID=UPI002590F4D3|nr:uncharacterized protein LOC130710630 [Lotus japonicus]